MVKESEGRSEPLGSGRLKEVLLRFEMMMKRLSGCQRKRSAKVSLSRCA